MPGKIVRFIRKIPLDKCMVDGMYLAFIQMQSQPMTVQTMVC